MNDREMMDRLAACVAFEGNMTDAQKTLAMQIETTSASAFDAQQTKANLDARQNHVIVPPTADKNDLSVALKYIDLITDPVFTIVLHQDGVASAMSRQSVGDIINPAETARFFPTPPFAKRLNPPKP